MVQAIEMSISWIVPKGCCPLHGDFFILRVAIFLYAKRCAGGDCVSASDIACSEVGLTVEDVQHALNLLVWNGSVVVERAPDPMGISLYRLREDVGLRGVIFRS